MTTATLLDELRAAGVTVELAIDLDGPPEALTDDRLAEVRRHKADLLRTLCGDTTVSEGEGGAEPPTEPARAYSAAKRAPADTDETDKTPAEPTYTPYEQAVLTDAGVEPGSLPLLDEVKAAFPDAEVLSVEPELQANPRREAAVLVREARQRDAGKARDLRDAWHERMARCTIDGRLSEQEAERVALAELTGTKPPADTVTMTLAERRRWIRNMAAGTAWHERQCQALPV